MPHKLFFFAGTVVRSAQIKAMCRTATLGSVLSVCIASGTDLTIHLPNNPSVSRESVKYQCDAKGASIGVPSGAFPVEYINGGGNSLVVVPISGNALVFSNVMSGSGARYTTQQYTWWEAKNSVVLYSDSLTGKLQSTCQALTKSEKR
jgi:membrane-bound inhibitor of C-type lysozyme